MSDALFLAGSSPLARGLLIGRGDSPEAAGIIPARAGFTDVVEAVAGGGADHPRSRGVYKAARGDAEEQ